MATVDSGHRSLDGGTTGSNDPRMFEMGSVISRPVGGELCLPTFGTLFQRKTSFTKIPTLFVILQDLFVIFVEKNISLFPRHLGENFFSFFHQQFH